MPIKDDVRIAMIQQDWETFRYQDKLRWSRFQTISAIEVAYLAAVYKGDIGAPQQILLTLMAIVLVIVISCLAVKDGMDAMAHIERAEELQKEEDTGIPKFNRPDPLLGVRGTHLMLFALGTITLLNVLVLVDQIVGACHN